MSGVSLPVTRPVGRALVVGGPGSRSQPVQTMQRLGFSCAEADDPYAAMLEIARRPVAYSALILSLAGTYKEELAIITTIRRRYPQIEIWLAHTDNRPALLAEAMRLGADGLLSDDGLHRIAVPQAQVAAEPQRVVYQAPPVTTVEDAEDQVGEDFSRGEPVLTAEELRALLEEQPAPPVSEQT